MEQVEVLQKEALALPDRARSIKVVDKASMEKADVFRNGIKALHKAIDEHYKPMADAAFRSHRQITGQWKESVKPLEEAENLIVMSVKAYQKAERDRVEAEQRRLAEEARKVEEDKKLREAEAAASAGDMQTAEAILEEPIIPEVPEVKPDVAKVDQRSYRTVFKARVVNTEALILFVADMIKKGHEYEKGGDKALAAAHREWAMALTPNDSFLNNKAKSQGKDLSIPGVQSYEV